MDYLADRLINEKKTPTVEEILEVNDFDQKSTGVCEACEDTGVPLTLMYVFIHYRGTKRGEPEVNIYDPWLFVDLCDTCLERCKKFGYFIAHDKYYTGLNALQEGLDLKQIE